MKVVDRAAQQRNAILGFVSTVSCLLWLGFLGMLILWQRFNI